MGQIIQKEYLICDNQLFWHKRFQRVWEWFSFGVLGLNSFIMLYYRSTQGAIQYVVCAGAVGYALVLFFQTVLYRHSPDQGMRILKVTRKVFRLIYTAIYLTSIMMNIIVASQMSNGVPLMIYYGWSFIWVTIWGTNCLWGGNAYRFLMSYIRRIKSNPKNK